MTIDQFEKKREELSEKYRKELSALQREYAKSYDAFKEGDLIQMKRGWLACYRVGSVKHFAKDNGEVYTTLFCTTCRKDGSIHASAHSAQVNDQDVKLLKRDEG